MKGFLKTYLVVFGIISIFVMPSIYMVVAPEYMGLKDMVHTIRGGL